MDTITLEQLLWDEESHLLDFKSEQYRFDGATDPEKSELLKDILGFCNARRRGIEAHILIGVKEVRGGKSDIVGIDANDQLEDHSLQQFVNSKTNRNVDFSYEAYAAEGKQIGVITIREQHRPIYLKKDFGKLKKNAVYVRRGSSTDLGKPAEPDEIALMGAEAAKPQSRLTVEFSELDREVEIGVELKMKAEYFQMPPRDEIPDFEFTLHDSTKFDILGSLSQIEGRRRANKDYYRELAEYQFVDRLYRPIRLQIKNDGDITAKNVRVEIVLNDQDGVRALDEVDIPEYPKAKDDLFSSRLMSEIPLINRFKREPGETSIFKNEDGFKIEMEGCDMQPGRKVWSEKFYIAVSQTGVFVMNGLVFADELPRPLNFQLRLSAEIHHQAMSVDELCELTNPEYDY